MPDRRALSSSMLTATGYDLSKLSHYKLVKSGEIVAC